jgi:hypothetical protein
MARRPQIYELLLAPRCLPKEVCQSSLSSFLRNLAATLVRTHELGENKDLSGRRRGGSRSCFELELVPTACKPG